MKPWSRRGMIAVGLLAALGGTALRMTHPFGRRYPRTPYDDLIARLTDREAGAQVGAAVLRATPGFDTEGVAARLRGLLKNQSLAALADADVAAGRIAEAGGWVLPRTLALLCALTAKVSPIQSKV